MVKLTQEVIEQAAQFTNPVKDRQLDLRSYKIPAIENLGATLDQFDTIDFTDNEIKKIDNFPLLKRLKCLLISNNHVNYIGENLEASLPNLESLVLINNRIQELGDLDALASVKTLKSLSLLTNPVSKKRSYRAYVIHKIPQLSRLDFQRIKLKERQHTATLFEGKRGEDLLKELGKRSRILPPSQEPAVLHADGAAKSKPQRDNKEIESIKAAIASATTLEEIERLKSALQSGQKAPNAEVEEMEM